MDEADQFLVCFDLSQLISSHILLFILPVEYYSSDLEQVEWCWCTATARIFFSLIPTAAAFSSSRFVLRHHQDQPPPRRPPSERSAHYQGDKKEKKNPSSSNPNWHRSCSFAINPIAVSFPFRPASVNSIPHGADDFVVPSAGAARRGERASVRSSSE